MKKHRPKPPHNAHKRVVFFEQEIQKLTLKIADLQRRLERAQQEKMRAIQETMNT